MGGLAVDHGPPRGMGIAYLKFSHAAELIGVHIITPEVFSGIDVARIEDKVALEPLFWSMSVPVGDGYVRHLISLVPDDIIIWLASDLLIEM